MGLAREDLLRMYRLMLLSRALNERMWILQRAGVAPFIVTAEGHEAAQVGSAYALDLAQDHLVPYYRDIGVVLTAGMTADELMLNALSKAADPNSGGRQMPAHYFHKNKRIVSGSSPVSTHLPHAAGVALASKMRGESAVTAVYFGDGGASKGDFHEAMNFAAVHKLPVVFICEHNGYAISVPYEKQAAATVAGRAEGYGMPGLSIDGNDVLSVFRATRDAADRARAGQGPTLIEARTYRFAPHTSNDDDSVYRTKEEVDHWRQRDPIDRCRRYLSEWDLLPEAEHQEIKAEVARLVDEATKTAQASADPDPATATLHVFKEAAS